MSPIGYDPITLNHWLWFKYQCHECSPADFQRLFENIIKCARPEFIAIKPYGNIGDRKCDGLFHAEGAVFQVYSPDDLKQAELKRKIKEDLDGAVKYWKNILKEWTFVYNVRRGLPPDIPGELDTHRRRYPQLNIDHLSGDGLWEMARGLTLQQRSEVFGSPNGYEHLFLSPGERTGDRARNRRRTIRSSAGSNVADQPARCCNGDGTGATVRCSALGATKRGRPAVE